jgi:hypothetical protein
VPEEYNDYEKNIIDFADGLISGSKCEKKDNPGSAKKVINEAIRIISEKGTDEDKKTKIPTFKSGLKKKYTCKK